MCSSTFQPAHRVQDDRSLGSRRAPHSDTAAECKCSFASIQALLAQNCRFLFQVAVSGLAQLDEISSSTRPADPQQSRAPDRFMLMAFASDAYLSRYSTSDSPFIWGFGCKILLPTDISRYRYYASATSCHSLQTRSRGVRYH